MRSRDAASVSAGRHRNAAGPPARSLVAIDVGGTKTTVACYEPATGALRRVQLPTHASGLTGRAALRRLIGAAMQHARYVMEPPPLAVAAVFPGAVHKDRLLIAPNAPMLEGIDLRREFVAAFGDTRVVLDNDVKAGALAEHTWGALRGADQALYLNIGTGLAAAAVIDGEVYRGQHGAALEIGYQLTPFADAADTGRWLGWRDNRAPMEALFSGAALDALARELLGAASSAKHLFESRRADVRQELARRVAGLAAQVVNLAIAFDVEKIAIGGGVSRQYAHFGRTLVEVMQRLVPFPPALLSARFPFDASLWGALELARRAAGLPALADEFLSAPAVTVRRRAVAATRTHGEARVAP